MSSAVKNHRLYSAFREVSGLLARHQFVCWIAGGAVRDFILGRPVQEFDLVTDATTEALKTLFPHALPVGESFGVLKLPLEGGEFFDLATFRQESDYADGRRPSQVAASTPVQDARRRDFTVNALYWDDRNLRLVDYEGGLADLARRRLVCVGDPAVRFAEDHLRILRLLRFAAVLRFEIAAETYAAALAAVPAVHRVSGERIWSELKKIGQGAGWGFILGTPLARALLAEVLQAEPAALRTENLPAGAEGDIFILLCLIAPETDFSTLLKQRLRVSNQEVKLYQRTRFLLFESGKLSGEELAFAAEKSPELGARLEELVHLRLMEKSRLESVQKLLADHSAPLLSAAEVSLLVPVQKTGEEYRTVRLAQFAGSLRTRSEVESYLKKKYAEKA